MEKIENRQEYHDVIAQSLSSIIRSIAAGETEIVKQLAIFNIRQAYIIFRLDNEDNRAALDKAVKELQAKNPEADIDAVLSKELDDMKLDKMPQDKLLNKMFCYNTLAGIKPVQTFRKHDAIYARSRSELIR